MPSVARELPLDQPLYRRADLNDHSATFCALPARFRSERIIIGKFAVVSRALQEQEVAGCTHCRGLGG